MRSESCQAASFVHVLNDWAIRTSATLSSLSVRTSLLAGRHRCTRAHTNNLFGVKIKVCFNLCKYTLRFRWKNSATVAVLKKQNKKNNATFVRFSQWRIVNFHMASHITSKKSCRAQCGRHKCQNNEPSFTSERQNWSSATTADVSIQSFTKLRYKHIDLTLQVKIHWEQ